ncbi:DSBA-like thioredoxin domain protein [Orientia chuto str. Dubai]|uniref:DSBA-like thioredoxin domain protein n=1 Tax=Orientia chuto str. Dubai TaxID=1359168 RepID=A0A0F3MMW0_9RICK|nr:DsbA family protein [Candidatus Orientia mediorientalis]KJV57093.1 DSBA-like thioredoxin domain protein [Orientia chuto str. Dubai]
MMILSIYKKAVTAVVVLILCSSIVYAKLLENASTTIELVSHQANDLTLEKINEHIKQYILDHPEVIVASIDAMQKRKQQQELELFSKVISEQLKILHDTHKLPSIGNGDIIVNIFYDYHCKYCKQLNVSINKLIAKNKDIKVIWLPLPILGELSNYSARVALAVYQVSPGKFDLFHNKMMSLTKITSQAIESILVEYQINVDEVLNLTNSSNVQNIISEINNIALKCRLNGVPLTVIDGQVYSGLVDKLQLGIDAARERKKNNQAVVCPIEYKQ